VDDGFLDAGETLGQRREQETLASAEVLGVAAVEFLGYTDSGMMGTPENDLPGSFWTADVEEAAGRLAEILRREQADALTVYDAFGNYGHPDHIQVHRVGVRAAALAGTPRVYEATVNQDDMIKMLRAFRAEGELPEGTPDPDNPGMGVPASSLTTAVDVSKWITTKRASMRAHASQIGEQSVFLAMSDDFFLSAFGTEWYIRRGVPTPVDTWETTLF
jgi:LmbE family N-acetylglucosaminyl deacetylase